MTGRNRGGGGGGGSSGSGGGDAEVTRLAYEALPAQKKMAINMGSAYSEYQRRYNWLMQMVQDGLMDPYTALKLQIHNHIHSERLGNMHLELMTRDDTTRYHALSRIKGVKKEPGQLPQPVPKEPHEEFFSFEHSAFVPTSDLSFQYGSVFDVLAKRCEMQTTEVVNKKKVELPSWVPALRNYIIDAVSALPRMYEHQWYTNKMKVKDERIARRRKKLRDMVENFEENLDFTVHSELKEMFGELPKAMQRLVIGNVRRKFAKDSKRRRDKYGRKESSEESAKESDSRTESSS
jgi:hypothetical protein